jgi:hypothetical protein
MSYSLSNKTTELIYIGIVVICELRFVKKKYQCKAKTERNIGYTYKLKNQSESVIAVTEQK